MKRRNLIWLIVIIAVLSSVVYGLIKWQTSPGKYDDFATCLTAKEVKMYGTDWCHFCQEQKKKFGKSFKYIGYVNCDVDREECDLNNIKGYPTWIIGEKSYSGVQPLEYLATLTECELYA